MGRGHAGGGEARGAATGQGATRAGGEWSRRGRERARGAAGGKGPRRGRERTRGAGRGARGAESRPGAALGREGEGEEREREGELTSRLDNRQQPLTGIPPRARGDGREVEERDVATRDKEMRERGAHIWGERAPGSCHGPGREPAARTYL
jgi:hypothetical protein